MDARAFIRELTTQVDYEGQVVHVRAIESREAAYAQPQEPLSEPLAALLRRRMR